VSFFTREGWGCRHWSRWPVCQHDADAIQCLDVSSIQQSCDLPSQLLNHLFESQRIRISGQVSCSNERWRSRHLNEIQGQGQAKAIPKKRCIFFQCIILKGKRSSVLWLGYLSYLPTKTSAHEIWHAKFGKPTVTLPSQLLVSKYQNLA